MGMGRPPVRFGVLGVTSTEPVLSVLAALGLAQSAGSALVIDLCGNMAIHGTRTLSDLAAEGPSLTELAPGRPGVALLPAGPVEPAAARSAVEMLAGNWPAVVLHCAAGQWEGPVVPVKALLPGLLRVEDPGPAVWQPVGAGSRPPGPGPVLPRLRGSLVRRLLAGHTAGRTRWVRAWEAVWGMPWA